MATDTRTDPAAEKAQRVRDLKMEVDELRNDPEENEIVFKETSPRRRMVTLYSMVDGEPVPIPRVQMERVLSKPAPGGGFMFTSKAAEAPEYKLGDVKCFLHPDSPDREALKKIGLSGVVCERGTLASTYSKRIHAQNRHGKQWAAYQEYVKDQKEAEAEERARAQLEATLSLARNAAGNAPVAASAPPAATEAPPEPSVSCDHPDCGYEGTENQVRGHKLGAHK